MHIAILGRERQLCLAELIAKTNSAVLVNPWAATFTQPITESDYNQLGGVIKIAKIINQFPTADLATELATTLVEQITKHHKTKKLSFAVSVYAQIKSIPKKVHKIVIATKKQLASSENLSLRYISTSPTQPYLNAAQIIHNKLVSDGFELICVVSEKTTYLAKTMFVQDIDSYALRDRNKPYRDSKTGMLPPKLAQTMINLARTRDKKAIIIDPFCGSGTIISEAALMGHDVIASDIEPRHLQGAKQNFDWLKTNFPIKVAAKFIVADARKINAAQLNIDKNNADNVAIVSEGYLGNVDRFLTDTELNDLNKLYTEFLCNCHKLLNRGARLVIAVPFWRNGTRLSVIDQITNLGYNYIAFDGIDSTNLLYRRASSRVGRHILPLTRQ